ncbi:MAG TPA: hypothetical protein ENN06_00470 [Desulfobacteraceae bacterium]|nr:hypothetical protein [Desulfobacteraceae bacterium]
MYLARTLIRHRLHFIIRESYLEGGCYRSRDLLDLGPDPHRYITPTRGGNFALDEWIADSLRKKGAAPDPFELEKLFIPYLDPVVRQRAEMHVDRQAGRAWKPISALMRRKILNTTHEFDRRRVHYLRFGEMDQRRLDRPAAIYRVLLDKSRDEIEQYFLHGELILRPREYKSYVHAIFDLQRFFTESYAHTMPEALNEEKLDRHFIEQVCKLDRDSGFWEGMERDDRLPQYLIRYVIMYFDYGFPAGRGMEDYIRSFMDSHRRYAPPRVGDRVSLSEAATIFGISRSEIASLTRLQFKRLFRKKARELHPDKGGSHEKFIELTNAYHEILRTKKGKS